MTSADRRARVRALAFTLLLWSPGLIPLIAPYLPFQDWPGHLGTIGALLHKDDPAAHIGDFFQWNGWHAENRLFYTTAYLLAQVLPPLFAAQLLLGFCIGAMAPAMAALCRATDADERLAVLAMPIALGRHLYCGFALNVAALALLVLCLAAYFRIERADKPGAKEALTLWALMVALVATHGFFYLVAFGLISLGIALRLLFGPRRVALIGGAALLFSFAGFIPQYAAVGKGSSAGGPTLWQAVVSASVAADRRGLARDFWEWLFASYRYAHTDDVLQALWALLLVGAILLAARGEGRPFFDRRRTTLLVMAGVTVAMFIALPSNIGPPLNWWGGNLRLPPIAALLLIPVAGRGPEPSWRRAWLLGAAALVSTLTVGLAALDLGRFSRREMAGFDEVLRAIPAGRKISTLHYTPAELREYPGEPLGYAGNYYILEKGGLVPQNFFDITYFLFSRKAPAPAPPWGAAEGFNWDAHGPPFDGFLVRIRPGTPEAPFTGPLGERVKLVAAAGNWRYYEKR
jgi:hypothetical protein